MLWSELIQKSLDHGAVGRMTSPVNEGQLCITPSPAAQLWSSEKLFIEMTRHTTFQNCPSIVTDWPWL
jgi:hypothetical protein